MTDDSIKDAEKWENGELGQSAEHAVPADPDLNKQVDEFLGLETCTFRISKGVLDTLANKAKAKGIGLNAYIRSILTAQANI